MDNQILEKKTAKYLRNISLLNVCKTNPVLRLHYLSESNDIEMKNEITTLQTQNKIECKFCYSSFPSLKILRKRNSANPKQKMKSVNMYCKMCKHSYPKEMSSDILPRLKVKPESVPRKIIQNISPVIVQNQGKYDNVPKINSSKKKNIKDINAGLIIPPSIRSSNFNEDRVNLNNAQKSIPNKNQKLAQMLSKVDALKSSESTTKKLDKFFDAN